MVNLYQRLSIWLSLANNAHARVILFSLFISTFTYAADNDMDNHSVTWARTFEEKPLECGFEFGSSSPKFGWVGFKEATPLTLTAIAPESMTVNVAIHNVRKGGVLSTINNGMINIRAVSHDTDNEIAATISDLIAGSLSMKPGNYNFYFESSDIPESFAQGSLTLSWEVTCT